MEKRFGVTPHTLKNLPQFVEYCKFSSIFSFIIIFEKKCAKCILKKPRI